MPISIISSQSIRAGYAPQRRDIRLTDEFIREWVNANTAIVFCVTRRERGSAVEPFDHRVVDLGPRRNFEDHLLSDEETSDWVDPK
jgi:hypothetical protein